MISFFRKKGGSGEIRGTQIAEYLNAKINPKSGYGNDTCIYVKMQPPEDYPKCSYLDIVDGIERLPWLRDHPDMGIISSSLCGLTYLRSKFDRFIYYIPQHHCNFERIRRRDRPAKIVGVVGGSGAIMNKEIKEKMDILHLHPSNRIGTVLSYKCMDIQVIWRITNNKLKNPLKIINAASFGIPTVAYPSPAYEEMEGYYYPVKTVDEMIDRVEELKHGWDAYKLIEKSEEFHIDNIAKMYKECLWN